MHLNRTTRDCTNHTHNAHYDKWFIDARDDIQTNATKTHTSILLVPPRISPFNFDRDITEGMHTRLMCSSSQGDQPFNITWLKDQRIIVTRDKQPTDAAPDIWRASDQSMYYVDNTIRINDNIPFTSILQFENLTSTHNGNYTCRISNHGGTADHTAILSVAGS